MEFFLTDIAGILDCAERSGDRSSRLDRKPNVLGLVRAWFKPLRWAGLHGRWMPRWFKPPIHRDANLFWQDCEQLQRNIFHGKSCIVNGEYIP
jgi:hypothetical protein